MTAKSLLVRIGTDVKSMEAGFKKADALIQKNSEKFKKAGRAMTIAGGAIIGAVTGVVKAYADFDKSMTESTAIMGDVSDTMRKKMAEAAKDMSEASTFAAKDLAQAYFYLASAGMDAEQSIAALPAVTKFAQAGAFDLALATDLLTDAQTALGLSSKDAKENQENLIRVSDVLVKANTLANASVQQFSEALTNKAAAALVNVNKEMEEGVAVLAAYADKGVKGNLAGQRLTMMLNGLFQATQLNKKEWDAFGVSLFDSRGEMRPIADIIEDLGVRFKDMTTEQKQATLATLGFNLKTKDSILTLMGSSEKIRQWTKDMIGAGGTTEKVANKQLESLINQLTIAKNTIVNTAISLGEDLAPMVIEIADKIKAVIEKVRAWIKEHPELTKGIALTAAKVGALLVVLGPIAMMLPGLVAGFSALVSPLGLVAAGLGLITIKALEAKKAYEKSMDLFQKESEVTGKKIGWLEKTLSSIDTAWAKVARGIDYNKIALNAYNEAQREAQGVMSVVKGTAWLLSDGIKSLGDKYNDLLGTLPKTKEEFALLVAGKKKLSEELINNLNPALKELYKSLEDKTNPAIEYTVELAETAAQNIGILTSTLRDFAFTAVSAQEVLDNLKPVMTQIWEEPIPKIRELTGVLENAVTTMQDRTFEVNEEMKTHWTETFDNVAACVYTAINGIDAAFAQAYENQMIRIDNEEKRTLEAIDNKYDATIEKNEALLEAEKEKTKEILKGIDDDYKAKKEYIQKNVKDEEKKAAMLADLEKKHELDLENARTEREQAEQETATALEKIEEAKNEALRIASEELEKKREAARKTAAKQEKAVALMSAIVNTATGVTKALSSGIPPWNIILAGITAAAGAVQIGLIKAQPIPLKEGGLVTSRTVAELGEAGPELVIPLNKLQPAYAGGGLVYNQNVYFYGDINNAGDLDEISRRLAEKTRRAIEKGRS